MKICQIYIIHEMFKIEDETSPERFIKLEKKILYCHIIIGQMIGKLNLYCILLYKSIILSRYQ